MSLFGAARKSLMGGSPLPMTPGTAASTPSSSAVSSPFFAPSSRTPTVSSITKSPGGTRRLRRRKDKGEDKSSVGGATFNLINGIVGAGIVGIPYAIKEAGLVSGVFMVMLCAVLTVKSLRLLIETAKHIDVQSYETLCEASFGQFGFYFISAAMFANAYGAMVSYLMIVKETLPVLLGFAVDDEPMKRAVLTVSTMLVILPLSMQRDMANLAKTSIVSVCFDLIMVVIVIIVSPVQESVAAFGGMQQLLSESTFHPDTFFIGVGVLSFAFVCQHASFIIAGSLRRPTKDRWGMVTGNALLFCGCLATVCGAIGYVGFLDHTDGNILNNLGNSPYAKPIDQTLAMLARTLMCTCMFFVYPIESFVARHVLVVLCFKGRKAHEGDDHAVLARKDRRVAVTLFLYLLALGPALVFNDLGPVLAISGSIGGSSLSYIGPGAVYLAVHGEEFMDMVRQRWGIDEEEGGTAPRAGLLRGVCDKIMWYLFLMPLWVGIASIGQHFVKVHEAEEALKSPHIGRLGKIIHHHQKPGAPPAVQLAGHPVPNASAGGDFDVEEEAGEDGERKPLIRTSSMPGKAGPGIGGQLMPSQYGAPISGAGAGAAPPLAGNRGIAAAIAAQQARGENGDDEDIEPEDDPQEEPPTIVDYLIAIFLFAFGIVALTAGLISTVLPA